MIARLMATVIAYKPSGHVANVGVHGKSVDPALTELWIKNIDISLMVSSVTNTFRHSLKPRCGVPG
jgi:alcohol dehydrogenase